MVAFPGPPAPTPHDNLRRLARRVVDPGKRTALDMLATATDLREDLETYQEACVREARRGGHTWAEIASVLGGHRQNIHRKYAHVDPSGADDA